MNEFINHWNYVKTIFARCSFVSIVGILQLTYIDCIFSTYIADAKSSSQQSSKKLIEEKKKKKEKGERNTERKQNSFTVSFRKFAGVSQRPLT